LPPDLSIIIVSWNVRDLLRACLASLPANDPRVEVIVVDAASADGTPDMVRAEFPSTQLIASADNLGYTRGNNMGLRAAHGRYFLILNPDTEVLEGALARMQAYLDEHPRVGVVGPRLEWPDGTAQPSRRRFPTLGVAFFDSTWIKHWMPRRWRQHYGVEDLPENETTAVDWVVGAALMVRREAWEQTGDMDEGFFMYSEELDWQRRIKAAGWDVVYLPEARIIHHIGKSAAQVPAATHIRFNTSKVRFFRKYHGAAAAEVLRWYLLGHFAVQWLIETAKGWVGHKPELRRQRAAAYREVLRSGLREA